jgi:hypothetical protein
MESLHSFFFGSLCRQLRRFDLLHIWEHIHMWKYIGNLAGLLTRMTVWRCGGGVMV